MTSHKREGVAFLLEKLREIKLHIDKTLNLINGSLGNELPPSHKDVALHTLENHKDQIETHITGLTQQVDRGRIQIVVFNVTWRDLWEAISNLNRIQHEIGKPPYPISGPLMRWDNTFWSNFD